MQSGVVLQATRRYQSCYSTIKRVSTWQPARHMWLTKNDSAAAPPPVAT